MKKSALLLGAGALIATGVCAVNDIIYRALIHRNFEVPESVSRFMSEVESTDRESTADEHKRWMENHGLERHYITNCDGKRLVGYLLKPKKPSSVYVFGAHGYRSDGKGEWCYFAKHYVEDSGFNFFFVDHQAAGESEGEKIGFGSFESRDCMQWLSYLNNTFGSGIEIILHGISMGSATVMLMCGNEELPKNVKFAIADCGFTSAFDEFSYKVENLGFPSVPLVPMVNKMNVIRSGYDFKKDTNALESVKRAKLPMLFIHGDKDKFVPTYMGYVLYENCSSEHKELLIVEGADHAESYYVNKKAYEAKIKEFIDKYIDGIKTKV